MKRWLLASVLLTTACMRYANAHIPQTDLSPCAVACIQTALPISGCEATNTTCLCTSQTYAASIGTCLKQNCSVKEALTTKRYQEATCDTPVRDEGDLTRRITWALFAVVVFSIVARFIFRAPVLRGSGYGPDDWTILLAVLLVLPLNVIINDTTLAGLGHDIWEVSFDHITKVLYFSWVGEFLYVWIMSTTKISIISLYLRIFAADVQARRDWFRIACFCMITFLALFAIVMSVTLGFECNPISFAWLRWDGEHTGSCFNLNAQIFAIAGLNIGQDLLVCFLPLPKLFAMVLPLRKKLVAVFIFLVGLFVTVCSVIRLQYLVQWDTTGNPTWYYNPIALWSVIECNLAIFCACLPSIAGLFQRIYRSSMGVDSTANASHPTTRRSAPPEQWHELNSPSYGEPNKQMKSRVDTPPAYEGAYTAPRSGWV